MSEKPWEKDKKTLEWYKAAAEQVRQEAAKYPDIGIPVDPDLAEFMGAFEDPCLTEDDWVNCDDHARHLKELDATLASDSDKKDK
ncbi:MAG: hypothetical protein LBT86_07450 [Deltaproteobacteria bacterium]|jgi:hypothetical protein|nr:hypothetical protein [Deltaproteobacteria bacterium]